MGILIILRKTKLYSTVGGCEATVFLRKCVAGFCSREYDGYEDSLFLSTHAVACGYEVGWEFVEAVLTSKQTFSGFRRITQARYDRYSSPINFLAVNTLIDWWFAWASAMNIDFIEQCFNCGNKINALAADGTKLGITLKQSNIVPLECEKDHNVVATPKKRYDRTLINNANANNRKQVNIFLVNLCQTLLQRGYIEDNLMEVSNTLTTLPDPVRAVFLKLIQCTSTKMIEKRNIAHFMLLLLKESSLTNIIPLEYIQQAQSLIDLYESQATIAMEIDQFVYLSKYFCPELGDLLYSSTKLSPDQRPSPCIVKLLEYIVCEIKSITASNVPPLETRTIHKYNPPKYGRAYYFSKSGNQIRKVRSFSIDLEKGPKENFDDTPDTHCQKSYPIVSKKGVTYLFLWFCPSHGHCYGYHIITGSEGRKDAANSLYTFLEKAPKYVFYDFACSLDEFVKNRESGFFENTRFFHDIFHGYTHKCSDIFKSNRLLGFKGLNTSICEQFNSFIQCIKASSKLMTQEHFTFYVQFFIKRWNVQR